MRAQDVNDLTEKAAKKKLKELIKWMDEQDCDDAFGTEGWRHAIGWED